MCYLVDCWSVRQGLFRHVCSREREVVMTSAAGVFFSFDEILIIICIISRFYRYDQHLCLILFHFLGGHICHSSLSWSSSGFERQPLRGLPSCNAAVGEDRRV
jgi:hypothetical protein